MRLLAWAKRTTGPVVGGALEGGRYTTGRIESMGRAGTYPVLHGKEYTNMAQNVALQTLIDGLNDDLAGEYNAIISYIQYSARVTGPYRPQLVQFLQAEIPDEQRHAQYLADKIASLGGVPVVEPRPVKTSDHTREMLHFIYEAEAQTVENYRTRIEQAEAAGELGLKVQLEEMLADETTHRDETKKMLDGWA